MKVNVKQLILTMMVSFVIAGTASAGLITYVDATTGTSGNTTFADGSEFTPPIGGGGPPANDAWQERTGFANNGNLMASNGGSDSPELKTTVTVADAGTYDVYVYYWAVETRGGNGDWDVAAGLTSGALTDFLTAGGVGTESALTDFDSTVLVAEGNRKLFVGHVGQLTVGAGGSIDVYVDDVPGNDDRTWYDGIGYSEVPEPATMALLGLGGLAMLRRRK